jgi:hypothetical protein
LPEDKEELKAIMPFSKVSDEECNRLDVESEGIVARTDPTLFDRMGNRIMWKLKFSDFK